MIARNPKSNSNSRNKEVGVGLIPNSHKGFVAMLAIAAIVSFLLGCLTRIRISFENTFHQGGAGGTEPVRANQCRIISSATSNDEMASSEYLPKNSAFSFEMFPPVKKAVSTCTMVHLEGESEDVETPKVLYDSSDGFNDSNDSADLGDEALNHPTGQHLLVDIKNVDANFLNSEARLSHAIANVIREAKLTLLSYQCHSLVPVGVSCVGVLRKSHIALHTWPLEGVISLDLSSCGNENLIPVVTTIERFFAIQQVEDDIQSSPSYEPPAMLWMFKLRGFREYSFNSLENDLGIDFAAKRYIDLKRHVISKETEFQQVDVIQLLDPRFESTASYQKSLSNDGSYESRHPELFDPNVMVYLDGQIQSSLKGEKAYHEALVHPAMMAHANPKRVAIIGGGEGATLREVLKHDTVEKALMIEIDREVVEILREFAPEWSNCSDFCDNTGLCYDDPRAELLTEDAIKWFVDRFEEQQYDDTKDKRFDVIIMDALDPNDNIEFASGLYNSTIFEQSLMNALVDDGVLVAQLGRSPTHRDPADEVGPFTVRAGMVNTLKRLGFESIHVFDEAHAEFDAPWSYLVALKDRSMRQNWYRNGPELNIDIQKRIRRTKSGEPTLASFDASTMLEYQVPPKTFEANYCRQSAAHVECNNPSLTKQTAIDDGDISNDSCLLTDGNSKSFHALPSKTLSIIEGIDKQSLYHFDILGAYQELCALVENDTNAKVYSPVIERHLRAFRNGS